MGKGFFKIFPKNVISGAEKKLYFIHCHDLPYVHIKSDSLYAYPSTHAHVPVTQVELLSKASHSLFAVHGPPCSTPFENNITTI